MINTNLGITNKQLLFLAVVIACYFNTKNMNKDKLENELASAVISVLMKHITTGTHENGQGLYLDCKIDFRYLKNAGAILVEELNFNSEVSEFNKA